MIIYEKLNELIKDAMTSGQKEQLNVLRLIKAEMLKAEKAPNFVMNDAAELKILQNMITQREDSANEYRKGGRPELAEQELAEANIIKAFMPELPSDEDIKAFAQSIINAGKPDGSLWEMKDMKTVMTAVKGRYDVPTVGKIVSEVLKSAIANQ